MNEVLLVDDEAQIRLALEDCFRREGWKVSTASGAAEALSVFRASPCPLVVTDMRMPDGDGLSVMAGVRSLAPRTGVILLTGFGSVPEAVRAIQGGAADYLLKPVSFEQLRVTAEKVLQSLGYGEDGSPEADGLVGNSAVFRQVVEQARQVARSDADILIEAESGTGKELLARFIHRHSARHRQPFVAVNCAAFPETLLESEVFGHVRGAFTGATAFKPGKFELAHRGTLLLDEVSEMPLSLQPKLLRVLQEREIDRLGDTRPVPVDVRVIATTNRSLWAQVEESKFRSDLYYRLNVIPLRLPPLRERKDDIRTLALHFLRKYAARPQQTQFAPEFLQGLQAYHWPGNVRELENMVRRALVMSPGPVVGVGILRASGPEEVPETSTGLQAGLTLREMEKSLLALTLEATGGNRTRAAEMLGVSLRTIRNKIREYGLPRRGAA